LGGKGLKNKFARHKKMNRQYFVVIKERKNPKEAAVGVEIAQISKQLQ
jgi:hypothetical protein